MPSASGKPISVQLADGIRDGLLGDVREQEVLLARDPHLAAERLGEVGDAEQLLPRDESDVHRHADRGEPGLPLRLDAEVVGGLPVERLEAVVGERVAEPPLDLGPHPLRAVVVDHELHARLHAREAVAEVVLPGVEQRAQHRQRLGLRDEDAEVARHPRHGGEPAADEHGEALGAVRVRARRRARCS